MVKNAAVDFKVHDMIWDRDLPPSELMAVPQYYLHIRVATPGQSAHTRAAIVARGNKSMQACQTKMGAVLQNLTKEVQKLNEEDAAGDTKAFSKARKLAKQATGKLEHLVERLRKNLKHDAQVLTSDKTPPETSTVSRFRGISVSLTAFSNADPEDQESDETVYDDLAKALKYKNCWQFCGVVASGTLALVQMSRNRAIRDSDLRTLRRALGKSGNLLQGICKVQGSKMEFHFLKSDRDKVPQEVHLRSGLRQQLPDKGRSFHVDIEGDLERLPTKAQLGKFDPAAETSKN